MNWHLAIAPVFRIIKGAGLETSAGFFNVVAAQFFISLADSALLIAAIGLLLAG